MGDAALVLAALAYTAMALAAARLERENYRGEQRELCEAGGLYPVHRSGPWRPRGGDKVRVMDMMDMLEVLVAFCFVAVVAEVVGVAMLVLFFALT